MPDEMPIGSTPVYEGQNEIVVNAATMARIVSEWLHNYHSGGPYEVTGVVEQGNKSYEAQTFRITFKAVQKP